jgi:ribosome-interacting GTPase 1
MSKYIPKVGEAFEWRSEGYKTWHTAGVCIAHSANEVGYESPNGWITTVNKLCEFRPIPTKSDVERDELIEVIYNNTSLIRQYSKNVAIKIQQAGFTIPPSIKRSDVHKEVCNCLENTSLNQRINLADAICELLGDLVEQDKGGAE